MIFTETKTASVFLDGPNHFIKQMDSAASFEQLIKIIFIYISVLGTLRIDISKSIYLPFHVEYIYFQREIHIFLL